MEGTYYCSTYFVLLGCWGEEVLGAITTPTGPRCPPSRLVETPGKANTALRQYVIRTAIVTTSPWKLGNPETAATASDYRARTVADMCLVVYCVCCYLCKASIYVNPVSTWSQYLCEASIYVKPVSTWSQYLREASIYVKPNLHLYETCIYVSPGVCVNPVSISCLYVCESGIYVNLMSMCANIYSMWSQYMCQACIQYHYLCEAGISVFEDYTNMKYVSMWG